MLAPSFWKCCQHSFYFSYSSFLSAERGGVEKSSSLSGKRTLPRFRILSDTSHSCRVSNWTDKQECYYFRHQKFKMFPQQTILIMQKKRERWFFEILRLFRLLPTVDRGKGVSQSLGITEVLKSAQKSITIGMVQLKSVTAIKTNAHWEKRKCETPFPM